MRVRYVSVDVTDEEFRDTVCELPFVSGNAKNG